MKRTAYAVGDRVYHKVFGFGTVQKVERGPWRVTVYFDGIQDTRTLSGWYEGMNKAWHKVEEATA